MVAPARAHFQHSPRKTFAHKPATFHKRDGGLVAGLNVCFEAMQLERAKCVFHYEEQTFAHEALPGERSEGVVAERSTLKRTADDVVND